MIRKAESRPEEETPMRLKRLPDGMLIFAGHGHVLTDEMVKSALEEEDEESGRSDANAPHSPARPR